MRRTEQEFKEEVLRRSSAYRQKRAKTRKNLLTASLCVCLCIVVLKVFDPLGAKSEAPAMVDDARIESAVSMQTADAEPAEKAEPMMPASEEMAEEMTGSAAGSSVNDCAPDVISTVRILSGGEEIMLEEADAEVIREYLTYCQWIEAAANCLCDYTFAVDETVYRYHSDCGTVQDEYGKSMILSEADKIIFNHILQKYQG